MRDASALEMIAELIGLAVGTEDLRTFVWCCLKVRCGAFVGPEPEIKR